MFIRNHASFSFRYFNELVWFTKTTHNMQTIHVLKVLSIERRYFSLCHVNVCVKFFFSHAREWHTVVRLWASHVFIALVLSRRVLNIGLEKRMSDRCLKQILVLTKIIIVDVMSLALSYIFKQKFNILCVQNAIRATLLKPRLMKNSLC